MPRSVIAVTLDSPQQSAAVTAGLIADRPSIREAITPVRPAGVVSQRAKLLTTLNPNSEKFSERTVSVDA
jgi:hypothetical protein